MNFRFNFRFSYFILVFLMLHFASNAASWPEECDQFIAGNLKILRESRSELKRPDFPFVQAIEILEFVEKGKQTHGIKAVTANSHFAELFIDVCDIINLQHPAFKTRYDIFIEQWEGPKQVPFSLFTFDRIAQVFHFRQTLFDLSDGSAYSRMVEHIMEKEIPSLRSAFVLIQDLDTIRQGKPLKGLGNIDYSEKLKVTNASLDLIASALGSAKAKEEKTLKTSSPPPRVRGLCTLSAMAHDYLTLGRIEGAVNAVLGIPAFTDSEQREAFLAGMIQIGELATNKNLSRFVRHKMPTILWEEFVHCRDAIEHQDEHGFDAYFLGLIDGSNTSVDFKTWQEELRLLAKNVSDVKLFIWKNNPQEVFEIWLQNVLIENPLYGVVIERPQISLTDELDETVKDAFRQTPLFKENSPQWKHLINGSSNINSKNLKKLRAEINRLKAEILSQADVVAREQNEKMLASCERVDSYLSDKAAKKAFRETPIFVGSSELWGHLTSGTAQVSYLHLQELRANIGQLRADIPTLGKPSIKEQAEKFLGAYERVETFLWDRLKGEAIHLNEGEKTLLRDTAKTHFNTPDIVNLCIALLNMDQSFLTKDNCNLFIHAAAGAGLNYYPIFQILKRFRPEMMVTRQVCQALPYDNSKDLAQPARRDLAQSMFIRTTHHLHNLAHGPDFEARMMQEVLTIPMRYSFEKATEHNPAAKALEEELGKLHETHAVMDEYGYANLTPEGLQLYKDEVLHSGIHFNLPKITPEFTKFGQEVMGRFYDSAHKLHLPKAIGDKPTTYLASVYSLSVGIGSLKEWTLREAVPPLTEVAAVENLRDGRNFIAHGDILRNMNNINLADIQESLLTNHLDHCTVLKFKG